MKRLIILLWLICTFGSTFAQKDLLKDLITNIQSENITIIGCLVNEEFIESEKPFVKKVAIESGNLVAFMMSEQYFDESNIVCRNVLVFNRKIDKMEEYVLNENHKILDDFLKKQKNKEFLFFSDMTF